MTANNRQVGGNHYSKLAIQPMEYALKNKLNYAQANAIKYVTRYNDKNGIEDLKKAIHCIELLIQHEKEIHGIVTEAELEPVPESERSVPCYTTPDWSKAPARATHFRPEDSVYLATWLCIIPEKGIFEEMVANGLAGAVWHSIANTPDHYRREGLIPRPGLRE